MISKTKQIELYLLAILFFLLPFSSWLVSLTGISAISLFRDLLIAIIFLLALFLRPKKFREVFFLSLGFVIWGALTFFWREASVMQWLKGYRFDFMPVVLFAALSLQSFSERERKVIYNSVICSGIIILLLAILEVVGIKIPLVTRFSGSGALATTHTVGMLSLARIQSVLAGPNALGLYLVSLLSFLLLARKNIISNLLPIVSLILLVLTFSRSAIIGAIVLLFCLLYFATAKKINRFTTITISVIILAVCAVLGLYLYHSKYSDLVTHNTSSEFRLEQYKRIWSSRTDIGLIGRGTGTAGPSSQSRLDNGENHWTENVYLDLFEELGFIGLLLYLVLIGFALKNFYPAKSDSAQKTISLALAYLVMGIFINYYTGQAGLYLYWLALGLHLNVKES